MNLIKAGKKAISQASKTKNAIKKSDILLDAISKAEARGKNKGKTFGKLVNRQAKAHKSSWTGVANDGPDLKFERAKKKQGRIQRALDAAKRKN